MILLPILYFERRFRNSIRIIYYIDGDGLLQYAIPHSSTRNSKRLTRDCVKHNNTLRAVVL